MLQLSMHPPVLAIQSLVGAHGVCLCVCVIPSRDEDDVRRLATADNPWPIKDEIRDQRRCVCGPIAKGPALQLWGRIPRLSRALDQPPGCLCGACAHTHSCVRACLRALVLRACTSAHMYVCILVIRRTTERHLIHKKVDSTEAGYVELQSEWESKSIGHNHGSG